WMGQMESWTSGLRRAFVSIPLIFSMLGAMFTVHIKYGFSAVNTMGLTPEGPQLGPPGYEINLLYIAGLVALILGGAGPLSFDALGSRRRQRDWLYAYSRLLLSPVAIAGRFI